MAEFLIALLELFEEEGRTLRRNAVRVGLGLTLVVLAEALLALAAVLLVLALFVFLNPRIGLAATLVICGLVTAAAAGGILWGAKKLSL